MSKNLFILCGTFKSHNYSLHGEATSQSFTKWFQRCTYWHQVGITTEVTVAMDKWAPAGTSKGLFAPTGILKYTA